MSQELRRRAAAYLRRERADHTLQPTALVHEAYIRLLGQQRVVWQNRAHFFGIAAQMMRRILVDHAREHQAAKRPGAALKSRSTSGSGPSSLGTVWRPDGRELYYLQPGGRDDDGGGDVQQGRLYDVAPDGRFLINTELDRDTAPITLLQHWNPAAKK